MTEKLLAREWQAIVGSDGRVKCLICDVDETRQNRIHEIIHRVYSFRIFIYTTFI